MDKISHGKDLFPHFELPESQIGNELNKVLQVSSSKSLISKYTTPLAAIATAGAFFIHCGISLNLAVGTLCAAGAARSLKEYQLNKDGKPLLKLALCIAGLAAAMALCSHERTDLDDKDVDLNAKYADLEAIAEERYRQSCLKGPDCVIQDGKMKSESEKYFNDLLLDKYDVPLKDVVSSLCTTRITNNDVRLDCLANIKKLTFDKLVSLNTADVGANHLSSDEDSNGQVTELWSHGYLDLKNNNKYVTEYDQAIGQQLHLQIHLFSNDNTNHASYTD